MTQKDVYTSELAAMFNEEIDMLKSKERESLTKQRCYSNEVRKKLKIIFSGE